MASLGARLDAGTHSPLSNLAIFTIAYLTSAYANIFCSVDFNQSWGADSFPALQIEVGLTTQFLQISANNEYDHSYEPQGKHPVPEFNHKNDRRNNRQDYDDR